MKKRISLILVCIMMFTLTACSKPKAEEAIDTKSTDATDTDEKTTVTSSDSKSNESSSPSNLAVTSTLASPAKIGDWVETKRYSSTDQDYHTVYLRITNIIKDSSDVDSIIEAYNNANHLNKLQKLKQKDLEYRIIKYEVMFPSNFPQTESGITFTDMSFHIRAVNGEDYFSSNESPVNLSAVYDISDIPDDDGLSPGDTFSDGTAVFIMQKDSGNYLIENTYYINQQGFSCYFLGI